jgi:uncharacterized FAD-dependent dehydrogenase
MELELKNIKLSIENWDKALEMEQLKHEAAKKLNLRKKDIQAIKIIKKSVDARKKDDIRFIYSLAVGLSEAIGGEFVDDKDIFEYSPEKYVEVLSGSESMENRPIIIGSGPAGLFCGLLLAERGYKPLILERGKDVDSRTKDIDVFWQGGIFNEESNVQFGEGGAGTFSDGKLTTRIKDSRCDLILQKFVEAGAPEEILYMNKPHIGTDILKEVVKNLRNRIIELGGEVRFNAKVTDIIIDQNNCKGVVVNNTESIYSDVVLAALGHSARDTYKMLFDKGVSIAQKAFSIGLRIEHHQSMMNEAQQGKSAGNPALGAADYILTYRSETTGRSAYSFCMCPGGAVVAAASEVGMIVTNGMSEYARDKQNANSALVVSISPEDFGSTHPLAGIEYQRTWERKAFEAGGWNYNAPAQLVGDFLAGVTSSKYGKIRPSYTPGVKLTDLHLCLPDYVTTTLKEALKNFDRKIKGFARKDALLTGVETRTSAPIRIVRKQNMESENIANLYPIGEGAGYAGGIISAAVDGLKAAENVIGRYKPIK